MISVTKNFRVIYFHSDSTGKAQLQLHFRTRNEFIPRLCFGKSYCATSCQDRVQKIPLIQGSNRENQCTIY